MLVKDERGDLCFVLYTINCFLVKARDIFRAAIHIEVYNPKRCVHFYSYKSHHRAKIEKRSKRNKEKKTEKQKTERQKQKKARRQVLSIVTVTKNK